MTTDPTVNWIELLERLAEPFPAEAVQWRAGATSRDRKRAQALPYADPRLYEDRLNSVCPGDWQVVFKPWTENRLICELTIHSVTRASTGEFADDAADQQLDHATHAKVEVAPFKHLGDAEQAPCGAQRRQTEHCDACGIDGHIRTA